MVRCGGCSTAAVALKRESATTTRRLATAITNAASIGKFFDNGPDGCIENSGSQMMDADGVAFGARFRNGDCWPDPLRGFRVRKREHSMKLKLKPLREQVMVITGASSGIGAATAKMAAERGAKVVLVGRQENRLNSVLNDIVRGAGVGDADQAGFDRYGVYFARAQLYGRSA